MNQVRLQIIDKLIYACTSSISRSLRAQPMTSIDPVTHRCTSEARHRMAPQKGHLSSVHRYDSAGHSAVVVAR
jgi:hypothetical protein